VVCQESCFLSTGGRSVCLLLIVAGWLRPLCVLYSRFASCEVVGMLLMAVCAFWRVLFWFLIFTREVVSAAFHTFWSEVAKFGFTTKLLTSVTLKLPT
jgi:hypothetical protein